MTKEKVNPFVRPLPPGIEPVQLKRTKTELPVACSNCNMPFRPEMLQNWYGKRLCIDCINYEERSRKTESLMVVVKELLTRKLDQVGRDPGLPEGALELNVARKAFLAEFGGETTFGAKWAQLVKHVYDRAMTDNKNVNVAAKMFADVAKFLEAAKDREAANFSKLTLEEMRQQHANAVLSHMRDQTVSEAMSRLLELAEAAAMENGNIDEILIKFDRALKPADVPRLEVSTP